MAPYLSLLIFSHHPLQMPLAFLAHSTSLSSSITPFLLLPSSIIFLLYVALSSPFSFPYLDHLCCLAVRSSACLISPRPPALDYPAILIYLFYSSSFFIISLFPQLSLFESSVSPIRIIQVARFLGQPPSYS